MKKSLIVIIVIVSVLFILTIAFISYLSLILSGEPTSAGNVALIPVKGVIVSESEAGLFSSGAVGSADIVSMIKKADENDNIKAIIVEINSPGGSAVASDEIGTALKATHKPTIAWIRELGASGGYWIASSCDTIVANRMSMTGSIGVISSYLQFSGLLDKYNVTYERLVSGAYKDMGSPWKEMSDEERARFQAKLDLIHEYFIEEVATNRNMSLEEVRALATGEVYLGAEALQLGLIDYVGGEDDVKEYLKVSLGIKPEIVEYKARHSFFDSLTGVYYRGNYAAGQGIGYALINPPQGTGLLLR
jgi:protease IV